MATGTRNAQHHNPGTSSGGDVIAAAARAQLALVSSFGDWLALTAESDGDRHGIIRKVQRRLDSYRDWLLEVEQEVDDGAGDPGPWAMDARIQAGDDDGPVVIVSGPGSGAPITISTTDDKEAERLVSDSYLGYLVKISHALDKSQATLRSLLQATHEVRQEESRLSQPAEATIKTHIRRLQEYNDVKDMGQQLIGLIAENRGVPIRTLYETGEFGVGPSD